MKSQPFFQLHSQTFRDQINSKALQKIHEKQLNTFRLIVTKLCFKISLFQPQQPLIKQAYSTIQTLQNEWKQYKSLQDIKIPDPPAKFATKMKTQKFMPEKPLIRNQLSVSLASKTNILNYKTLQKQQKSQKSSISPIVKQENQQIFESISLKSSFVDQTYTFGSKSYKAKLRDEFFHIRQFVFFQLQPKLEEKFDKLLIKKVVLNCYIAWNRKKNREMLVTQMAKLQMELTVQIKQRFPNVETKKRFFKGLGFKDEYRTEMSLTDRKPPVREIQPQFDEQCIVHPIDEILKQARGRQKTDQLKPFNEYQIRQLDEALGLN